MSSRRLAATSFAVALATLAACAAFGSADDANERGADDAGGGGSRDDGPVSFPFDASSALRIFLSYGEKGSKLDGDDVLEESECADSGTALVPPGTFVPFVAKSDRSIESYVDAAAPYVAVRQGGAVVPLGRGSDLLEGKLLRPVSTELVEVWTGAGDSAANCSGWSVDGSGGSGMRGRADLTDGGWLEWDSGLCDDDIRVYCIETGR